MAKRRVQADCKADTRGGRWAGIPVCVIESAAYRNCTVHAKAILVELVARMMGYNNGKIALSQRQLVDVLGCAPRKVVRGLAQLMEHGLIDVSTEGKWKERMAREYRLTFVSTKNASATNDYLRWRPALKSGATTSAARGASSATASKSVANEGASRPVSGRIARPRKTANCQNQAATDEASLIVRPYVQLANWWTADRYLRATKAVLELYQVQSFRLAA